MTDTPLTAQEFRTYPLELRKKILDELSEDELIALQYDWHFWARPEQLEPKELGKNGVFIWFIRAGRGFGKTRSLAEWVIEKVRHHGYRYISLVGAASDEVRTIQIEGEAGILDCSPPDFYPKYEPSKKRIVWPNGAVARIYYGSEPDKARGGQSDLIWCDEIAKWKHPESTFDNLLFGLRLGINPLCGVSSTPRPTKFIKELNSRSDCVVTEGNSLDNLENLAKAYTTVISKYKGSRLGRQELDGAILDDNPDALWEREWLDEYRVNKAPDLYKIIVGVDPEATDNENSSETGIVVVGEGKALPGMREQGKPHYYVLDDPSLKGKPNVWANAAITGYNKYKADRIVAEKNNGGDMVESTIKNVDNSVPVTLVWASRGKYTRAEPISTLYEQGRVHHVGTFNGLEDQLCEWVVGDKSPDRLDALVWGISWLAGFNKPIPVPKRKQRTEKTRSKVMNLPT